MVAGRAAPNAASPLYHFEMRLFALLIVAIGLCAQPPQDAPKKGGGRAPQNLKVLKAGVDLRQVMGTYASGLGVRCDHCHVMGNFASDENPKKETARRMIVMVQEINAKFPDGQEHVTCYTCHRGAVTPLTAAPPATPPAQ